MSGTEYLRAWREKNREKIRAYNREYNKKYRKEHGYKNELAWNKANPKKKKAQLMVLKAIREGLLDKEPCRICRSEENIVAHHHDYDQPLDVRWLCAIHHKTIHMLIRSVDNS